MTHGEQLDVFRCDIHYSTMSNELLIKVLNIPQQRKRLFSHKTTNHLSFGVPNALKHHVFTQFWSQCEEYDHGGKDIVFTDVDVYMDTRVEYDHLITFNASPWNIKTWLFTLHAIKSG